MKSPQGNAESQLGSQTSLRKGPLTQSSVNLQESARGCGVKEVRERSEQGGEPRLPGTCLCPAAPAPASQVMVCRPVPRPFGYAKRHLSPSLCVLQPFRQSLPLDFLKTRSGADTAEKQHNSGSFRDAASSLLRRKTMGSEDSRQKGTLCKDSINPKKRCVLES